MISLLSITSGPRPDVVAVRPPAALARRGLLAALAFAVAGLLLGPATAEAAQRWVATWAATAAPAVAADGSFNNQSLRQIVRVSLGGTSFRVQLSNEYGSAPLVIGAAHVAVAGAGAAIKAGTDRVLTFQGAATATIAPGARLVSDPVALGVADRGRLAVTLYFPGPASPGALHRYGAQTAFVSPAGDYTAALTMPVARSSVARYFLANVEVLAADAARTVVTLGDSITDGNGSTRNTNRRWPDRLAERLPGRANARPRAVINQGYSSNRLLHDTVRVPPNKLGKVPSALDRFARDVLDQAGVGYLVLLEGINDIGLPAALGLPAEEVTAAQITDAYIALTAQAHARGIKVVVGTLTPAGGAAAPSYGSADADAKRQVVNQWIRASAAFDAVVDFDLALRDPAQPSRLLPAYDSGDHIHPNDAGYLAMANAVNLALITAAP